MAGTFVRPAVTLVFEPSEEDDYPESGTSSFRTLRQPKSVTFTSNGEQVELIRYKYTRLASTRDIRLCRVNKEKYHVYGDERGPLQLKIPILEIVHYNLDECPRFLALSYAWGDMIDQRPFIGIGDESFICITAALFDALQPLSRGTGSLDLIWIDQICINQYDLSERASQVSMMRDIFRHDYLTYIWLGTGDESTDRAFELIRKITTAKLTLSETLGARHRDDLVGKNGSNLADLLANETDESWEALSSLIKRPWFSRLWTFQEVVVSGLVQAIVCGNQLCGWLEFGIAAWVCHVWMPGTVDALRIYNTLLTQTVNIAGKDRLLNLLRVTGQGYECSDPRDKVFALLGLIADGGPDIEINYANSVQSVFTASTVALMKNSNSLDHLSAVNEHRDPFSIGLASWCPDWREPPRAAPLRRNKYRASRGRVHIYQQDMESKTLQVHGKFVDVIEDVEESQPLLELILNVSDKGTPDTIQEHLRRIEQKILTTSGQSSCTRVLRDLKDIIIRTVTVDGTEEDNPSPGADIRAMKAFVFGDAEDECYNEDTPYIVTSGFPKLRAECTFCGHRQILTLQKHSIGLGPLAAQKGDVVSILHGSSTPVILRPNGDWYRVIGQCFVDGMMYGEEVSWLESEGDLITLV